MANVWWVNQRNVSDPADFSIIWAPLYSENDKGVRKTHSHWSLLEEVKKGDIILHNTRQSVAAVSQALGPAFKAPRPWDDRGKQWDQKGRRVEADVAVLDRPLPLTELDAGLSKFSGPGSPFKTGELKGQQGYFFRIPPEQYSAIFAELQISFDPSAPTSGVITIDGETDRNALAKVRREQPQLRRALLQGASAGTCALCARVFPAKYLVAAHIKRRSTCTEQERIDPNVAMLACAFGCDAAFESGDLYVDHEGMIAIRADATPHVAHTLNNRIGGPLEIYGPSNEKYFSARRRDHGN